MTEPSNVYVQSEETRIKSVYAQRQGAFRYSWFNPGQVFRVHELERGILAILKAKLFGDLHDKKVLEVGCGQGQWLRELIKWGAVPENLTGVDLLPDRIAKARELCPPGVDLQCGNAARLAFDGDRFDLILQFTVFSSILDFQVKEVLALEMLRVLKEGGLILWYDINRNNPWNPDIRGIRKHEIAQLFPKCRIDLRRVTLIPALSRLVAPYSWLGCYALERAGIFNTHYLGVIQKS